MDASTPVQSPFLPGTKVQYAWDSTSLGYLKTCPRLYEYTMIEGWESLSEKIDLRFGTEVHTAFQNYEILKAEGLTHNDALHEVVKAVLESSQDFQPDVTLRKGKYKNRRTLLSLVIDYLDLHVDDAAKTVILENGKPAVELSFRFELDWGPMRDQESHDGGQTLVTGQPYILCGHLDKVVEFQDVPFVMDYKTTTTVPSSHYFNQYEPSNQMTLYTLAAKTILESPVKGVIINACQILLEAPNRFVRGITYRTNDQLDEWLKDLEYWFNLAESYAEANYWPMNATACDKFGGCKFREICSKSPGVRGQFLKSSFTKLEEAERWNPLKPR
jgi:hypothetical protein